MSAQDPRCSNAMKRLMREVREMQEADEYVHAHPINDNLFEWHFTIRGQSDSDFSQGIYHGRLTFSSDYPMSPPDVFMLTPNGVFEVNEKICLSISSYHPETWLPSWSIRTGLVALIAFMPNVPEGVLGSVRRPAEERRRLALASASYCCPCCGTVNRAILKPLASSSSDSTTEDDTSGETRSRFNVKTSTDEDGDPEVENEAPLSCPEQNNHGAALSQRHGGDASQLLADNRNTEAEMLPARNGPLVETTTLSSFLTSTIAVLLLFFLMRNVYLWSNPTIDFN